MDLSITVIFIDREALVNREDNALGSVRPSVCPSVYPSVCLLVTNKFVGLVEIILCSKPAGARTKSLNHRHMMLCGQ